LTASCLAQTLPPSSKACDADQAQRWLEQKRPPAEIEKLLDGCASSQDYRVPLVRGVLARQQGSLETSRASLERAHQLAPREPAPTLELAEVYLLQQKYGAARELFEAQLAADPGFRPALLGLARVARAQYRLDEAKQIYLQLLKAAPRDDQARNGLAWVALASKQAEEARKGFEATLTTSPGDAEALAGLKAVDATLGPSVRRSGAQEIRGLKRAFHIDPRAKRKGQLKVQPHNQ
jgi:tetratricopeptide (TPR) repeat protein